MKTLPSSFRQHDRDFTILDREGDVALLRYGNAKHRVLGFEVIRVRKYPDREIMGNMSLAHEAVPPESAWGTEGWSYALNGQDKAYDKFVAEVTREPNTPIFGVATGKARGRERSSFELDLSSLAGKQFGFTDIVTLNPDTDEPMLRNRLKVLVDGGNVRVVGEVAGGRGKPRKIYEVVS